MCFGVKKRPKFDAWKVWTVRGVTRRTWITPTLLGLRIVAPIFGGFSSALFDWRFSFFVLAIVWGAFAAFAARYMVESCPDVSDKPGSYGDGIWKILAPGPGKPQKLELFFFPPKVSTPPGGSVSSRCPLPFADGSLCHRTLRSL